MLKKRIVHRASVINVYKGYSFSVNYDGEPSVSNGIVSQLPSSHLFIHRVPAKLSNGVYAPRSKLLPATALVCKLTLTDLTRHLGGTDFISGRYAIFCHVSVFVTDEVLLHTSSLLGFFPEPCPTSVLLFRSPARLWNIG